MCQFPLSEKQSFGVVLAYITVYSKTQPYASFRAVFISFLHPAHYLPTLCRFASPPQLRSGLGGWWCFLAPPSRVSPRFFGVLLRDFALRPLFELYQFLCSRS